MPAKPPTTTPTPKYGPTSLFGSCESSGCERNARVACPECGGHYCPGHAEHEKHAAQ